MGFRDLLHLSRLKILALAERIMCFSITLSPPSGTGGARTSHLKHGTMKGRLQCTCCVKPPLPDAGSAIFQQCSKDLGFVCFSLTTLRESHPRPSSLLPFFFSFLREPRMWWPNQSVSEGQRFAWEQKPTANTHHPHHPFPTQHVPDTVNQCGRRPKAGSENENRIRTLHSTCLFFFFCLGHFLGFFIGI